MVLLVGCAGVLRDGTGGHREAYVVSAKEAPDKFSPKAEPIRMIADDWKKVDEKAIPALCDSGGSGPSAGLAPIRDAVGVWTAARKVSAEEATKPPGSVPVASGSSAKSSATVTLGASSEPYVTTEVTEKNLLPGERIDSLSLSCEGGSTSIALNGTTYRLDVLYGFIDHKGGPYDTDKSFTVVLFGYSRATREAIYVKANASRRGYLSPPRDMFFTAKLSGYVPTAPTRLIVAKGASFPTIEIFFLESAEAAPRAGAYVIGPRLVKEGRAFEFGAGRFETLAGK